MKFMKIFIILTVVVLVSGCIQRDYHNQNQVDDIAESMLMSINNNNFESFSSSFSNDMKETFSFDKFDETRELIFSSSGLYNGTKEMISLTQPPGYSEYIYSCDFERNKIEFVLSLSNQSYEVEGVYFSAIGS